jgi:DNA (cytosine-5)-methyltransferase 1
MVDRMRFIDFFSGIGGFRLGMEQAGHTCVGHCEIDKYADASYRAMHIVTDEELEYVRSQANPIAEIRKEKYLHGEWYSDDIRRVNPNELPEAECYCFGFPCQSFSMAGLRRGFDDTRGTLFFEVMRLAKERHPEYLFAENVRGLLTHDGGATFGTIITTMEELGYCVEWQVLNSKYYVPQHRERVYIIGHFGGRSGREILPITEIGREVIKL